MLRRITLGRLACAIPLAILVAGCDDDGDCAGGERCVCSRTNDCYLECRDDACSFEIHDLVHGGGVCDDGCTQLCYSVTDCSLSCGDDCHSLTHDTTSSGTFCGDQCDHECHHVDRCGVVAGANSTIYCHNATTCEIELTGPGSRVECDSVNTCTVGCAGSCEVLYNNLDSGAPNVSCPPEAPQIQCSAERITCGEC